MTTRRKAITPLPKVIPEVGDGDMPFKAGGVVHHSQCATVNGLGDMVMYPACTCGAVMREKCAAIADEEARKWRAEEQRWRDLRAHVEDRERGIERTKMCAEVAETIARRIRETK